jgi:hypothetical protein
MATDYGKYGLEDENAVRNKYTGYYNTYQQQQANLAQQQRTAREASAARQQNANYINYMLATKALPEQMARMGLSGGATESSILRQNTNYNNTRYNTDVARQNDINAINQTYMGNLDRFRMENDQKRDAELASNRSALYERQAHEAELAENKRQFNAKQKLDKAQFKETKKSNAYEELRDATMSYDAKRVKKELKKLNKKKKLTKSQKEFKRLLLARQGQLKEQIKAEKRADKSYIKRLKAK